MGGAPKKPLISASLLTLQAWQNYRKLHDEVANAIGTGKKRKKSIRVNRSSRP